MANIVLTGSGSLTIAREAQAGSLTLSVICGRHIVPTSGTFIGPDLAFSGPRVCLDRRADRTPVRAFKADVCVVPVMPRDFHIITVMNRDLRDLCARCPHESADPPACGA